MNPELNGYVPEELQQPDNNKEKIEEKITPYILFSSYHNTWDRGHCGDDHMLIIGIYDKQEEAEKQKQIYDATIYNEEPDEDQEVENYGESTHIEPYHKQINKKNNIAIVRNLTTNDFRYTSQEDRLIKFLSEKTQKEEIEKIINFSRNYKNEVIEYRAIKINSQDYEQKYKGKL